MAHPPAYPHGSIEQIADEVFVVRGSIPLGALMRISRNMAIVRNGKELTLVNPIRLNDKGLKALDALGTVKHLIRLGGLHGLDDPFYVQRYRPTFWAQAGEMGYQVPAIDKALSDGGQLPFPNARLFCFQGTKALESAIVLERGLGVLLTCDAIQHYGDYSMNNLPARMVMPFIGFRRGTIIGPIWLKRATPDGGSLKSEFERLLTFKFDTLFAAHGTCLKTGAHASVKGAVSAAFAERR